jgi:hypothetical protein
MYPKRHYNKWTVNELLQLQREYELLNLSIPDIAKNHQRTEDSILYRLQEEELIDEIGFDLNESVNLVAVSKNRNNRKENTTTIMNTNKNDNSLLSQRVINLESSVSEMKTMVKQMVDEFMEQKRQKTVNRKPLRRIQTPNVFV